MKTLGLYLFIFGLGSLVLNLFDMDFQILGWMDTWGESNGYLIRFALIAAGVLMMMGFKKKPLAETFPELKEINELENSPLGEAENSPDSASADKGR